MPNRIRPAAEPRLRLLVAALVVLAYGCWFTDLEPFSTDASHALLRVARRNIAVRVIALAAWAWVGWHFFVHTSR